MKLKLTYTQFTSLYEIFKKIVVNDVSFLSMEDKLIHLLMIRIYKKMYKQAIERKPLYKINLDPEEAMSFHIYFQDHTFAMTSLEGILLTTTIAKIDQQYI